MRFDPLVVLSLGVSLSSHVAPVSGRALAAKSEAGLLKVRAFGVPKFGDPDPVVPGVPHNEPDPVVVTPGHVDGPGGSGTGTGDGFGHGTGGDQPPPPFTVPQADADLPAAYNFIPDGKQYTFNMKGQTMRNDLQAKVNDPAAADVSPADYDSKIGKYPPAEIENDPPETMSDLVLGDGNFNNQLYGAGGVDPANPNFITRIQNSDAAGDEPLSVGLYSRDQGTIGAQEKFSNYPDDFPLAPNDRIPQSEIVYRAWQDAATDQVGGLRNVYQIAVGNPETKGIIDAAMANAGKADGDILRIDANTGDRLNDAAFNALAGSDNGRPVFQMCIDHPVALGKGMPTTVYITKAPQYGMLWVITRP